MPDKIEIELETIHLELIDKLIPFYGNNREEVVRMITIDWLKEKYGLGIS